MKSKKTKAAGKASLDQQVRHPGLYRAQLACHIARDGIDGKSEAPTNAGVSRMEWAMYNLLHAVEEIAKALMTNDKARGPEPAANRKDGGL